MKETVEQTKRKTRLDYRFEKAGRLLDILEGNSAFEAELNAILDKVQTCRDCIRLMPEDADVTPALRRMVTAIERLLADADCAVLRTFLYSAPKRQDRALVEIQERLTVLEWLVNQLNSRQQRKGGRS